MKNPKSKKGKAMMAFRYDEERKDILTRYYKAELIEKMRAYCDAMVIGIIAGDPSKKSLLNKILKETFHVTERTEPKEVRENAVETQA